MKLTYEVIQNWYQTEELIFKKIKEIVGKHVQYDERLGFILPDGKVKNNWYLDEWIIDKNITKVSIIEHWAYGGRDNHNIEFPTDWLFDFNYEEELIKQKKDREEKKKEEEELKKKKEEEKEKEEYLKLKEKFEK